MQFPDKPIEYYAQLARDGQKFPWEETYECVLTHLKGKVPFSLSRYGDGEWNSILGRNGHNCDGHQYFTDMAESLASILMSEPPYLVGAQQWSLSPAGDLPNNEIVNWLRTHNITKRWIAGDVLHDASRIGDQ